MQNYFRICKVQKGVIIHIIKLEFNEKFIKKLLESSKLSKS